MPGPIRLDLARSHPDDERDSRSAARRDSQGGLLGGMLLLPVSPWRPDHRSPGAALLGLLNGILCHSDRAGLPCTVTTRGRRPCDRARPAIIVRWGSMAAEPPPIVVPGHGPRCRHLTPFVPPLAYLLHARTCH